MSALDAMIPSENTTTRDELLGGRLVLRQSPTGHRAGSDAVLLAAAVPARAGQRVLELGCGNGAAALCLARRIDGVTVVGIEIDPAAAELARQNAADNGLADRVVIVTGDIAALGRDLAPDGFDHVMMNPPYFAAHQSHRPADPARALARVAEDRSLDLWLRRAVTLLGRRGRLTVILRSERLEELLALSARRFGGMAIFPLWPGSGRPAKRFIAQGRKGSRRALRLLPGLVLHGAGSRYTPAAEAVLRHGAALAVEEEV